MIFITYGMALGLIALGAGAVLGVSVSYGLPDLMAWIETISGFR